MAPWKQEEGCQGQLSQEEVFRRGQDAMKAPLGCCHQVHHHLKVVVGQHYPDLKTESCLALPSYVLSKISPDGPLVGVGAEEEVGILELVGGGGWLPLPPGLLLLLGGPPTLFGPLGPPPPLGGPTGVPGPLPCVEPCGLPEPGPENELIKLIFNAWYCSLLHSLLD